MKTIRTITKPRTVAAPQGKLKTNLDAKEALEKMLETRSFDKLLEDGDVLDVEGARKRLGYSAWGLRRLCIIGKLDHIRVGVHYFFLPSQINKAFTVVQAKA